MVREFGATAVGQRTATLVVAASNALPASIIGADYVCTGANDEVEINLAIAALPAVGGSDSQPTGGGKVVLTEGTFNIAATLDLDGEIVVIEGQGREETILAFTVAGPCFTLNRNVSFKARVTLKDFLIYGDDTNTTYGIQLESEAAHNLIVNVTVYDMTTAGIRGDSGNSQNYFERVYIRGCDKGFDMMGNNNTYVDCLATNANGDAGTGPGFRSSETQGAYHGCFAEQYAIGYDVQMYATGVSFHGCSTEYCEKGYMVGGNTPSQPRATLISGGECFLSNDGAAAAVDINRSDGTTIVGLSVKGTTSGKDFDIDASAHDCQIIGGTADGATPITDAGTRTRIVGIPRYAKGTANTGVYVNEHSDGRTITTTLKIGSVAGTAEASTVTTLTDNDAKWETNEFIGLTVTCDSKTMVVTKNTGTKLTGVAWVAAGAPTPGAYTIILVDVLTLGDAADKAIGYLLYTFPAGACVIDYAYMSMAVTAGSAQLQADTPDVGLGTVIAVGVVPDLDTPATFEDIITGRAAADSNGTATVGTALPTAGTPFIIASGDAHTLHFNVAATWSDDVTPDLTADIAGTVVIAWRFLA